MIDRLLHIANSAPPAGKERRERFYKMKQRILRLFGTEDGQDIQFIEGKTCWTCDGTGEFNDPYDCHKCDGTGYFKHPVWVVLKRWKLGRYTFHEPVERSYRRPKSIDRPIIRGYIEHATHKWKDINRARFILCLLFDWRLLYHETANWRIRRIVSARCYRCKRHLWTTKRSTCSKCQAIKIVIDEDHDIPF